MKKESIEFVINKKYILNSNVTLHHFQKAKIAAHLRNLASDEGIQRHPERDLADLRLTEIKEIAAKTLAKSRARKAMNKKGETEEDIIERLNEIEEEYGKIDTTEVPYIFNHFKITLTACPPTKRRMDPPNLYPTLKALIDGLTDASWWIDDQFANLVEVSFKYGGISGEKDHFKLTLDIEEVNNLEDYVLSPELVEK